MHIAQNFIPMLNNQYKQYRCYYFSRGSTCKVSSQDLVLVLSFDADRSHKPLESTSPYQYLSAVSVCEERHFNLRSGVIHG